MNSRCFSSQEPDPFSPEMLKKSRASIAQKFKQLDDEETIIKAELKKRQEHDPTKYSFTKTSKISNIHNYTYHYPKMLQFNQDGKILIYQTHAELNASYRTADRLTYGLGAAFTAHFSHQVYTYFTLSKISWLYCTLDVFGMVTFGSLILKNMAQKAFTVEEIWLKKNLTEVVIVNIEHSRMGGQIQQPSIEVPISAVEFSDKHVPGAKLTRLQIKGKRYFLYNRAKMLDANLTKAIFTKDVHRITTL